MNLNELIEQLEALRKDHGGELKVRMIIETDDAQYEQPVADFAVSKAQGTLILLPPDFK